MTDALVPTSLALERYHSLERDLEWVAPGQRALVGAYSVGGALASVATLIGILFWNRWLWGMPLTENYWFTILSFLGAPLFGRTLGRRLALRRMRRAAQRLADPVSLRALAERSDGDVVRVRGVVKLGPEGQLPRCDAGTVFHRLLDGNIVRERAHDFILVDEKGEEMLVEVADARLLHMFADATRPEVCVRVGESVEVIGRKHRTVDPHAERLPHQNPTRTTLRAMSNGMVLIIPFDREKAALTAAELPKQLGPAT